MLPQPLSEMLKRKPYASLDFRVMERAHEHQVVEIRSSAVVPPDDVVRLREASRATAGEPALAVAVLQVSNHPRRRLSGHATEPDW